MEKKKFTLTCVTLLQGGAKDWGKHILLPHGVTLCGQPTVEAIEHFPVLKEDYMKDLVVNFKKEEWEITCEKCLEMLDVVKRAKERKNNIN